MVPIDFIEFALLEKKGLITDGSICFEAQIKVEKPTANVEALTDRIYQLESEIYKLKETCKGQKISPAIFFVFDSFRNRNEKNMYLILPQVRVSKNVVRHLRGNNFIKIIFF